jgi:predicted secreted hydrolase
MHNESVAMKRIVLIALLVGALIAAFGLYISRDNSASTQAQVLAEFAPPASGFARATGPQPFDFPATHGPHPEYQSEWWYYTGNLETADGRHFGYQLTFFRRALLPITDAADRESEWAASQIYFAHFAITDVVGGDHRAFERFARSAAGLAGAQADPYQVWLEDWQAEQTGEDTYHLVATQGGLNIDLILHDAKGPVLQGDQGYSQKGADPGDASYYYSLTRLETSGTVIIEGTPYAVDGLSWMDHEFSTSPLADDQVGWDWFALQFNDGSELMLYQFRQSDGTIDTFSSGTFIAADGSTTHLDRDDFVIGVEDTWTSPRTQGEYPAEWTVEIASLDVLLSIEPYLADQEMTGFFDYWEGAVRITGERSGQPLSGDGYIELTGYAGSMAGRF